MGKQVTLTDRITGEIIYPVTTLNSVYNLYNTTLSDLLDLINTEIQDRYTKLDIDTLLKGLFTDLSNTSDNKISITVGSVLKTLEVAYAANAGTLNGFSTVTAGTATNIYNHIPVIGSDGVIEIGKYIDFHSDNTTNTDYSTRIRANGNNSNILTLPTSTGTLALTSDILTYVPLSGGTLTGTALFSFADSGNWSNSNSGVTFPVTRGGFHWSGQSDWVTLFAEETGSDNLNLVLQFGDDNSNGLSIRNASGVQTAYISALGIFTGTLNGNADTATILQTARTLWGLSFNGSANISGALTGVSTIAMSGQLTSTLASGTAPFSITSTTLNSNLNADLLDGQHGGYYLSAGNFTGTLPSSVLGNSALYIGTTSIPLNRASASQTLTGVSIDGNAATATNADKLDNQEGAYYHNDVGSIDFATTFPAGYTINSGTIATTNPYTITGGNQATILQVIPGNPKWGAQLAIGFGNPRIAWRSHLNSSTWSPWLNIIAGSADSLTIARTINGTSFDGTGNITTSLWGTARNISIGGTSKSVNGSGDITWALSEISANYATTAGTSSYANVLNVYLGNECIIHNGYSGNSSVWINYRGATGTGITLYNMGNGLSGGGLASVKATSFIGSLTGNADSSTIATRSPLLANLFGSRQTSADITQTGSGGLSTFKATSSMTTSKPADDGHILHMYWDNTAGYDSQIFIGINHYAQYRTSKAGTWGSWITLLDSLNYNNYSPLINGSHATSTTSIYAPTTLLSVLNSTNSYLIGSNNTNSLNTVYSNGSVYMNGSTLYATTFNGALTGNADTANVASRLGQSGDSGTPMTFNWSGQSGQPSWLWGGNDGTNMYVYNPSNFNVNHAETASDSNKLGGFTEASFLRFRGILADGSNALTGVQTTGYSSSSTNYQTAYGDSLHIQGHSTWYNRLDFGTNGRIYFYQAINPSTLTGCMQYTGTLAYLTDIPTLSLTTSGTGNAVSSISVSGHTITLNLTTYNNYSLPTAADSTLGGVKTGYTTSGKNYKVSIDASGNLYTYVPWSDTWNANSVNVAGYVSAPTSSNANKVWKTDANGNPGWRTDLDTTSFTLSMAVSPGTSSITLAFGIKYLLTAGGSTYIFKMPDNPNTNYLTGMYVGAPWTASNSAVTNPYVNIYDTAIYRSKLQLVGAGGTTITSNDSSVITISSDSAGKIWVANSGITTKYTSGLYINLVAHGTTGCFTEVNNANIVLTVESESDGKFNKQLGFSSNGNLYYRSFVNADPDSTTAWKTIIDSGNIGSQAVTSASKLTTAVSIWGKTFDGSSNITGNLVSTGLSPYWDDIWSDGTNSHPWYGYDMNHANTGVYSTTISDYYGMTLKTANTEMSLAFLGGVSINTALTITSGGLNLYTDPLRFKNTSGTTLGMIGMDPGVLNIWGPSASNATTSTGIVLIGKQGGWRCIQIDSSNNTYIGATQSNMTASGYRLYVDGTQYISSTLTTGGNITAPAFYESSDYRLKNSIYTISNADVKLVDKIKLKEYRFNNDPSKKHYGVVAQDLLDLGMNDLVKGDEKSYYSVDYISLLILKMQAMQNKIDELTKKINNL